MFKYDPNDPVLRLGEKYRRGYEAYLESRVLELGLKAGQHYTRVTQAVSRINRKPGRKMEKIKQRLLNTERAA
jgi:hypothetical protein